MLTENKKSTVEEMKTRLQKAGYTPIKPFISDDCIYVESREIAPGCYGAPKAVIFTQIRAAGWVTEYYGC